MKPLHSVLLFCAGLAVPSVVAAADFPLTNFITVRDGKLFDGDQEFRFISWNIPNLLAVEDNVAFTNSNPWRLPDKYEINDALETVRQMGGTVARTYVITVLRANDAPATPRHVLGPGIFNETAFRALDEVLAAANRTGVRLIIPLVDNWPWMGGRAQYAGFRGKTKDEFWTDPQLISDFEQTIQFILTRTNTVTGVRYADDKAILCWETGNELRGPNLAWTKTIAACIKRYDPNHLVMDGYDEDIRPEVLAMPEVDIVTTHHYPGRKQSFAELIQENARQVNGKKPYLVGEFGFVSTAQMSAAMNAIRDSGLSGGLLWSLRFHNRDGGFYWHSEPGLGGNLYKAFHWPGSPIGNDYDEINLLALVRLNAFALRGLPLPQLPIPAPPNLLPIENAAAISWQGSIGASAYQVERAAVSFGDWQVIATNVDEAMTQYHPQFADETAPRGQWYYRVRAKNASGLSGPSNIVGPVCVNNNALVDDLSDFTKVHSKTADWKISTHDCRSAKEDAARAAGAAGGTLVYQLPTAIASFRVFVYFPDAENHPIFSVAGRDGVFRTVTVTKESYFHGTGEYGYWKLVRFHAEILSDAIFFKIKLTGDAQISRVEISHTALSR